MNNPFEHEFRGVKYRVEIDPDTKKPKNFFVEHPEYPNVPKQLSKYYALDSFSIDAFTNNYLFSFHPAKSNDKFDCYCGLVNFDIREDYLKHACVNVHKWFTHEEFEYLYTNNKRSIIEKYEVFFQLDFFRKYGAVSLTNNPTSILMWSHYTNKNTGFLLEFDTEILKQTKGFYGPFHINYTDTFEKIPAEGKNPFLDFLYMSNIKYDCWKYEDEWRIITFNENGLYHPQFFSKDVKTRKFRYDPKAVKHVILSFDFFDPYAEIKFEKGRQDYCNVKLKGYKLKLFKHIYNHSIPCSILIADKYNYHLKPSDVTIKEVKGNTFRMDIHEYQSMIM